jgi:hypothetical protein
MSSKMELRGSRQSKQEDNNPAIGTQSMAHVLDRVGTNGD